MFNKFEETSVKNLNSLLRKLKGNRFLSEVEYRIILKSTYYLLRYDKYYNICLSVICHVADKKALPIIVKQLLYDCIVESRVFLYSNMLLKIDDRFADYVSSSSFDNLAQSFYTLNTGTTLTKDQKKIFDLFQEHKRLIVSAPTSFGKSRIISEIILANNYNNIAIVLPTNALVNETYLLIRSNLALKRYKLITSLLQKTNDNYNLFVFTPEKMDIFLDENETHKFDLFIMDEIYKLENDDRSNVFVNCLYRLQKMNADFYLIGPYFKDFSHSFKELTNAHFEKFTTDIVQKDIYDINKVQARGIINIDSYSLKKRASNKDNLLNILNNIDGQTLIYAGRRDVVEKVAFYISEFRGSLFAKKRIIDNELKGLIKLIDENISKEWLLNDYLANGIAFHHSGLPKFLQIEIVNLFNSGVIDIIVCSPTLTEGVNTTAKNVLIYDNKKGNDNLLGFDVLNIKGRAGRFGKHFLGRVISLVNLPKDDELSEINFSYLDNDNLDNETLLQIDDNELKEALRIKKEKLLNKCKQVGLSIEVLKSNKFISIERQINLFLMLKSNPDVVSSVYFKGTIPNAFQLGEIFRLCYSYLFSESDKDSRAYYFNELKSIMIDYVFSIANVKKIISRMKSDNLNTRIRSAFSLISKRFEFTYPKYLNAFEKIYNAVNADNINLKYVTTKLEYGFIEEHLIALKETGLPNSVIVKLSNYFKDCTNIEDIRLLYTEVYKGTKLEEFDEYEWNMIDRYL